MSFGKKNLSMKEGTKEAIVVGDIAFALRTISKYVPWENKCRHQAYQAKLLLSYYSIPCQIFVGFKINEDNAVEGHAWTMAQGKMVSGLCDPTEYKILTVYS